MQEHLLSLAEVAEYAAHAPHRIIHLCETGLVVPAVDAVGRGKARSFDRDNVYRISIALALQQAGIEAPQIRPLMKAFDLLMKLPEVRALRTKRGRFDLLDVIPQLGEMSLRADAPRAAAWLELPTGFVTFVTPTFDFPRKQPKPGMSFAKSLGDVFRLAPALVVNLSTEAQRLLLLGPAKLRE